ncbi:hypothetical protein QQP08_004092 [Theobroma cacao]|nr:hypothetical protein QQP08_004092 [Theobroma cacao]
MKLRAWRREETGSFSYPGYSSGGSSSTSTGSAGSGDDGDYFGMIFGSGSPLPPASTSIASIFLSLLIILVLYSITNQGALPSLLSLLLL